MGTELVYEIARYDAVFALIAARGPRFQDLVNGANFVASGAGGNSASHRFAIFPAGSIDSVDQANALICAMGADSTGEPSPALRELLDELETVAESFPVVRDADSRGVIVGTHHPEFGPLSYLLRSTMARGLAVYDIELFRLYDPVGRVDVEVQLPGDVTLPYLTPALLRDLVIRPTWPEPEDPYFIIVRGDQEFVQTYRNEDGTYRLEYRDGGEDAHFAFQTLDIGLVAEVMWAWTTEDSTWRTAVPWTQLEFDDDEESADEPSPGYDSDDMYVGRHAELQNERRADGSWLNLDANLLQDGTLRIIGHDLGPVAESISPDGEYEYFYTIAAEDVPALVIALGGQPGTDAIDLLEQRWSGDAAYGLGAAIALSGVKHHFTNYF